MSVQYFNKINVETINIQGEDFKYVVSESESILLLSIPNKGYHFISGDIIIINITYPDIAPQYYKFEVFVRFGKVEWINRARGVNLIVEDDQIHIYYTSLAEFSKYQVSGRVGNRIINIDGLTIDAPLS